MDVSRIGKIPVITIRMVISLLIITGAIHDSQFRNDPVSATSSSNIASDTTWEFKYGLEGWAQATSTEMYAKVYHMGGEMRIKILSTSLGNAALGAHVDSPIMSVPIGERETLVMRYRFVGPSTFGKIRLRGGPNIPDVIDHGFVDWGNDEVSEDGFVNEYFPLVGDGLWHIGYAEIENERNDVMTKLNGTITQIRLWPGHHHGGHSIPPVKGNSLHVDWIRLVRAPVINRVTGCAGEKYFHNQTMKNPEFNIETDNTNINQVLHQFRTIWKRRQTSHPYSSTYNCLRRGGDEITIEGHNFGLGGINGSGAPAHVYIDGEPCTYVKHDIHDPQRKLSCITPNSSEAIRNNEHYDKSLIELRNGKLTGLSDMSTSLQYARQPPKPTMILLSNFASR